jgi:predicted MPP superfamily phosphohydrolase
MVQFTDIHFGEDEPDDLDNMRLISDIIEQEKPDLAIITGDIVSGYAWDQKTRPWTAVQYANLTKTLTKHSLYWATTAGNHDSEGDLTREEVSEFDRAHEFSLTQKNAANISHSFNYWLPIYDSNGESVQFRLWFLDTGHEDCLNEKGWDCVRPD